MNVIRGPWAEDGADFHPNLTIVRETVRDFIAEEVALCRLVGVTVSEPEVEVIEHRLWKHGLLEPGSRIEHTYPDILKEAADGNLDSYYTAA